MERNKTFSEMPAASSGSQIFVAIIVIILVATVIIAIIASRSRTQPVNSHASGTDNVLVPGQPVVSGPVRLRANVATSFNFAVSPYLGSGVGVEVQWGDGTSNAKCCDTATIALTHTYMNSGNYTIRARATSEGGAKSKDVIYSVDVEAGPATN